MNPPAVTSTIDLSAPGKQIGRLQLPPYLEQRWLGLRSRADCDHREWRRANGSRQRRQPWQRI